MPILSPIPPEQIRDLLKSAKAEQAKQTLKEILEENLSVEDIVDNVAQVLRDSTNDPTRLRAAELGAKLHGLLNSDEQRVIPVINVFINGAVDGINPILFPRETT
jgi:hypothetical protein